MGLFDSVMVPCPNCGTEGEFQSKSGPCMMDTYTLQDAPKEVLDDVNRHSPQRCSVCNSEYGVLLRNTVIGVPVLWAKLKSREQLFQELCNVVEGLRTTSLSIEERANLVEEYNRIKHLWENYTHSV